MFCPKCGSQNADETKFCRGCGADVSNALASIGTGGKSPEKRATAEKHIELFSQGLRGILLGAGFLVVAALAYALSTRGLAFTLFALAFAVVFLATGLSRLVHANGLKALIRSENEAQDRALTPGQADYIIPPRSFYDTDDLVPVSEHATTQLHHDPGEKLIFPKSG